MRSRFNVKLSDIAAIIERSPYIGGVRIGADAKSSDIGVPASPLAVGGA
jgi:hypothetical protein